MMWDERIRHFRGRSCWVSCARRHRNLLASFRVSAPIGNYPEPRHQKLMNMKSNRLLHFNMSLILTSSADAQNYRIHVVKL
jgi:hypothetical protein